MFMLLKGKVPLFCNIFTTAGIIVSIVILNIIIHGHFGSHDFWIFMINITSLFIIHLYLSQEEYQRYYVAFMTGEAVLSLLCFVLVTYVGLRQLPGYYEHSTYYLSGRIHTVYLTPYYTVGWLAVGGPFGRNAGMFWEPGAHAIYLNLALLFLSNESKNAKSVYVYKTTKICKIILIIASLSTLSTAGYISLALSILYDRTIINNAKESKKTVVFILMMIIISFVVIAYGDVFDKLINRSGSYITRANDIRSGLIIANSHPLLGLGYFTNLSELYMAYGVITMSAGIIGFLVSFGYVIFTIYILWLSKRIHIFFQSSWLQSILIFGVFFVSYLSESVIFYPVFISFLLPWKKNEARERISYYIREGI